MLNDLTKYIHNLGEYKTKEIRMNRILYNNGISYIEFDTNNPKDIITNDTRVLEYINNYTNKGK